MCTKEFKAIPVFLVLALLAVLVMFPNESSGQVSIVKGTVIDKQGNPLPNVNITFLDPMRGAKFTAKSKKNGEFVKIGITPSTYKIIFELEGYFPFELQYRVQIGTQEELKITLEKIPPKIEENRDYSDGIDFFSQGNYEDAIGSFKKSIKKFPENAEALYSLGVSYLRVGNLDEAINQLNKARKANPELIEIYLALGECYFNKGEREKALKVFSEAVEIQPDNPKPHYNLGIVFYKYDKTERAISSFEKSLDLNPAFSSSYYQLGLAYVKTGNFTKAIKSFEDFLRLEPDSPEASLVKEMIRKLKKQ